MIGRALWVALFTVAGLGAASALDFSYKALACTAPDGTALRIETDVGRDAAGRPLTDDQGFARTANGILWVQGTFDRSGDYYVFRFGSFTITVDRETGAAFVRASSGDPNLRTLRCAPVPPFQN